MQGKQLQDHLDAPGARTGAPAIHAKTVAQAWAQKYAHSAWCKAVGIRDWRPGFDARVGHTGPAARYLFASTQARLTEPVDGFCRAPLLHRYEAALRVPVGVPPYVQESVATHGFTSSQYFVVHCTEDHLELWQLYRYFRDNSGGLGTQASISPQGVIARAAGIHEKCWHVLAWNGACYGVELTGFDSTDWAHRQLQIDALTLELVYWSNQTGNAPVISMAPSRAFTRSAGLGMHRWIPDNDHSDPGPVFNLKALQNRAVDWKRNGVPLSVRRAIQVQRDAYVSRRGH
jgi:hypothetical protein